LVILVMSATIEAEPVARFLDDCPIVRVEGRTFPVEVEYEGAAVGIRELPQRIAELLAGGPGPLAASDSSGTVRPTVNGPRSTEPGHILIFLPGVAEIQRTLQRLEPLTERWGADLLPLHGSLPAEQQQMALAPSARRKIILATNIAETSLTIDGVRTVIDGGYARVARYDARRGLNRLDLERISQASADQRAGRAGRTGPGRAIRLWSEKQHHALAAFTEPDIRRVDLAGTVLALRQWGSANLEQFGWYEKPGAQAIGAAEELLEMLGAWQRGRNTITRLGQQMLRLPLHPRLGRLLIAAAHWGFIEAGCGMAALLSEKDILQRRSDGEAASGESDLLQRQELLKQPHHPQLDRRAVRQVVHTQRELMRIARRLPAGEVGDSAAASPTPTTESDRHLQAILLAYPDRVARRRSADPNSATLVGGGAVRLAHESIVRRGEFFLALDARHDPASPTRQALVHLASHIEMEWLEAYFPQQMRQEQVVIYDPQRDRVLGVHRLYYRDLLLKEETGAAVDPAAAGGALMEVVASQAEAIFRSDPQADQWLNRMEFLRRNGALDFEPPPLADLLSTLASGKRSLAELKKAPLAEVLRGTMPYAVQCQFERDAPTTLVLPNGRHWRLTYPADGGPPVLAVKLQHLLGLHETPRLARGRVPIRLHLLAPNGRPVQITDDLASFWKNTYPQVRKDLRARYPRHDWPLNPAEHLES
jgi:ATP-dependent helicase HrpB